MVSKSRPLLLGALLLAGVGCSASSGAATAPDPLPTVPVPSSTAAPQLTTTTAPPPAPKTVRYTTAHTVQTATFPTDMTAEEEAILETHVGFMRGLSIAMDPFQPDHPFLPTVASGAQLTHLVKLIEGGRRAGWQIWGENDSRPHVVSNDGDRATVVDCNLGQVGLYDYAGVPISGPDAGRAIVRTDLERGADGWRVTHLTKSGETCEL